MSDKWIISVGMISEGTDIPRLRVCCHLTRVKTELYFRQVLGRILRSGGKVGQEGYFFMPAEPALLEYAHRVAEDIPSSNTVSISLMHDKDNELRDDLESSKDQQPTTDMALVLADPATLSVTPGNDIRVHIEPTFSVLSNAYDSTIGMFGRFREQVIRLAISS